MNIWILLICMTIFLNSISINVFAAISTPKIPQTGQTGCWDTAGLPIDCGGSGQDGDLLMGKPWPTPRFIDNGDGTISDALTGLVWLKNATCFPSQSWESAIAASRALASGVCGLTDGSTSGQWYLPNLSELETLVNLQQPSQADWLNNNGFDGILNYLYWSSTPYAFDSNYALGLDASAGAVGGSHINYAHYVLPVRSATVPQNQQIMQSLRFVDIDGKTVSDTLTDLVWTKDGNTPGPSTCVPTTQKNWQEALNYVACLNNNSYLGKTDWRLPNRKEIMSLINWNEAVSATWLNNQGFSGVQSWYYWTSSSYAENPSKMWIAYLGTGLVFDVNKTDDYGYVWPVRSGQWALDTLAVSNIRTFGEQTMPSSFPTQLVTISNTGSSAVTVNIALSGSNANEFVVVPGGVSPCPSLTPTIAPGSECSINLGFKPINAGAKVSTLLLSANGESLNIPLSGLTTAKLTVTLAGTGGGMVTSNPAGIFLISGSQSEVFASSPIVLTPAPDIASTFDGWSGDCTSLAGDCSILMDSAKNVIATFTAAPKAKVLAKGFTSLQAAYDDSLTTNNSIIKLLEGSLAGTFSTGTKGITVTIEGGYNATYTTNTSETTIQGPVTLQSGTVRMEGIIIK